MRHAHLLALGMVLAVGALQGGCQNGVQVPWQRSAPPPPLELMDNGGQPVAPAPTGLALSPDQRFRDVPLPVGVREDLDRSYVYESANLQIGRMVYTSRASINELANFYAKEAPAADWNLERSLQAQGSQTLIFTKPGKRMEVQVQEQGVGRNNLLIINLTPDGGSGF